MLEQESDLELADISCTRDEPQVDQNTSEDYCEELNRLDEEENAIKQMINNNKDEKVERFIKNDEYIEKNSFILL
ncbi:18714_t:CDS:2, partial [Racocetra fulgida]